MNCEICVGNEYFSPEQAVQYLTAEQVHRYLSPKEVFYLGLRTCDICVQELVEGDESMFEELVRSD